jgi:hypothetical protein
VIHDTLQMTLLTVLRSLKTPSCLITAQAGRLIPHMQCGSHSCVPRSCRTASTIESATPRSKFTGHRLNCSIINDGVAFGTLQRLNYPPTSQIVGDVSTPAWKSYRPGILGQQLRSHSLAPNQRSWSSRLGGYRASTAAEHPSMLSHTSACRSRGHRL